jgi:hypothetical protein
MPRAIQRLLSPSEVRDFLTMDQSSCGWRRHAHNTVGEEEVDNDDDNDNKIRKK